MRVIIAGGGIVGLTTAVALRGTGADVVVYEQAPRVRAAGASIGLWSNALEVFAQHGVADRVAALGTEVSTWFHDATGRRHRAPGHGPEDHTFLLLPRARLNEELADAAGRDVIVCDRRVTGYAEDADGVTVRFADGGTDRADLLVGADGVYSRVRAQLLPEHSALAHAGHFAWRALVPSGDEPSEGTVLTVGPHRTRGGYVRTYGGMTMWMVNQFDCAPLTGTPKEQALERAALLNDGGWNDALARLIEATPDASILHGQIVLVPPLPRWTTDRVVLVGDAAHGLSPHIAAGGTLGVEDVGVLVRALAAGPGLPAALRAYEAERVPRYAAVREYSRTVELATTAPRYAEAYAAFSHWMLTERPGAI
jgi:2-polyprenyl-6-methoxyphenol hydroxylase-like FAD-dependent oxidoreductase